MESTKLNINLPEGTLEVEGSEDFVSAVYKDLKNRLDLSEKSLKKHFPKPLPKRSTPFGKRVNKPELKNVSQFSSKPLSVVFQ